MRMTPAGSAPRFVARRFLASALALLVLATAMAAGCSSRQPTPAAGVGAPLDEALVPTMPDLSAPVPAVRAYLDWSSFSYRMANSDISSATMSPYEGVRVDSYIQLNREKNRGIEQALTEYAPVEASRTDTGAVVTAVETWRYRYFTLDTQRYLTDWYTTTYDATYSVIATQGLWYVDAVEATPRTPVQ
jgi:hypothetical protein